eukprot:scaffold43864_cov59-Phaeocystis_antarctica.AAC.6
MPLPTRHSGKQPATQRGRAHIAYGSAALYSRGRRKGHARGSAAAKGSVLEALAHLPCSVCSTARSPAALSRGRPRSSSAGKSARSAPSRPPRPPRSYRARPPRGRPPHSVP